MLYDTVLMRVLGNEGFGFPSCSHCVVLLSSCIFIFSVTVFTHTVNVLCVNHRTFNSSVKSLNDPDADMLNIILESINP